MKKICQGTLLLSSLLLATQVNGNELSTNTENHFSVGIGSYAFSLANDDHSDADQDFTGFNIAAGYAFNNHFQVRATYFSLENDDYSSLESKGYDVMAYGGTGFTEKGFRGYGGAGLFSDKWSVPGDSESLSGIQFGGGVGYSWGPAALDFVLTLRQADEYEDFVYQSGTYFAMSGNLTVSYLF